MLKLSYLPLLIFVIAIIMYIVYSKRLGKVMFLNPTGYVLMLTFFLVYYWAGGIIDISQNFTWIQIMVSLCICANVQDLYKSLKD
ncbi:hypothetical protein [Lactobacillus ultunensis]|uniref:Holin n=1 Tax=Lactobacillus ultunensis DSM 16047 TaxID=525365 RepID=C2EPG4_9LACO|nr:hypothetical protein [Lactobacillus ultunensis]EEJ71540.1 hypothetical protein HMPREF0548_1560 [Lactobacillus ultunensis DSM 16047]KRL82407.1 hypothetical protein FC57_GL001837 [Lactobacillus ultunensis DSM 16047]QQP28360.1 hypothetical protein H4B44_09760 [Lactobacillus ultunensis]